MDVYTNVTQIYYINTPETYGNTHFITTIISSNACIYRKTALYILFGRRTRMNVKNVDVNAHNEILIFSQRRFTKMYARKSNDKLPVLIRTISIQPAFVYVK